MTGTNRPISRTAPVASLLACALMSPVVAWSAPGTISDSPLFLSNSVEPNVLFMLDDSGSMDWGLMTAENSGIMTVGCVYYYAQPAPDNDYFWVLATEEALMNRGIEAPYGGVWRAWNKDYNRLYYDPTVTYLPWPGENTNNSLYTNANPVAALYNPYTPGAGAQNLTADTSYTTDYCPGGGGSFTVNDFYPARYYSWADSDGDGIVDDTDDHKLIEIRPGATVYTGSIDRSDCAAAPACTYSEEIQNFANWFSYYRKREYVAKAGYGQVIATARNLRMGMVTLHNNGRVNTSIGTMNKDPRSGAKGNLLDALYSFQSAGGTPLRSTLDNGGKYLGCGANSLFGDCPALPASTGGECQQNFTILMTDGFYNGGFGGVGNADGDDNSNWDSGSSGPFGDTASNTLADIAMKYYETDLRPGVDNNLSPPPGGIDDNKAQHMVTYTVAFGVDGNVTEMPADTTNPFSWPTPDNDTAKIDDLRHSAWNGRGDFLSAQDPGELIAGLRGALRSIQGRVGSASSVAFNTGSLSTNSEVYLALFNSERWSGNLLAFDLDPNTGAINATRSWAAGSELSGRDLRAKPRTILTFDGSDGIPFQWSELTTSQQNDLRTSASGTLENEATGIARHGYVRGDRGCEVSSSDACYYNDGTNIFNTKRLRERAGRLGDIVHSGPVFAGTPESNWPDVAPFPNGTGESYTEFRLANATRPGVIYVGGDDGMLHAFSQESGQEIMGYIPSNLFSTVPTEGLHALSDPAYTHRYYVDSTVSLADAFVKTASGGTASWKTILVGGLRGGGKQLYALDVTDPTRFSEAGLGPADTVMWEFSSADDDDLGNTFGRPSIVPVEGPGNTIRWAAIVGNGYNDSGSGEAKLFILFLEGGLDGTWTAGSDYIEISTETGDTTNRNGLSTPAVIDTDGDGLADRAYAGDLEGNLWAFDFSGSNTGNWRVAYRQGQTPEPLFTAPADQPITTTPVIVRNKAVATSASNSPNTMVIFGTGQYVTTADITTTHAQSMYGVWDSGSDELDQGDLVEQDIGFGTTTESVFGRTLTNNLVDYSSDDGWYMNLPDSGERLITDPIIRGDLVFFNTMIPDASPCNFGGSGWLMVAKWIDGTPPDKVAFDLNNDGTLDALDEILTEPSVGVEILGIPTSPVNLGNIRYTSTTETTGGSTIDVTVIEDVGEPNTRRLSWEELTP